MSSICLSKGELNQITGRLKATAQLRWLRQHGFTALRRADGTPLVSRAHFEAKMGGFVEGSTPQVFEPNFGAL